VALLAAAALLVTGLVVGSSGAAVGQFTSSAARERYVAAYGTAMEQLPPPDAVLDVRTAFGVVRVHRFDPAAGTARAARPAAPLVLLPGRAAASPMWADNLPDLRAARTVYVVDLLGEPGMSAQDVPMTGDRDQARWLADVLAALPADQVHVVGYSIGGWAAANLARHDSSRIASLALVEPVLVFEDLAVEAVVRSIPASVRWLPRGLRDDFASWTAGGAPVTDDPLADLIEAGMQTYRLGVPAPSRIADEDVGRLEVPTLVVLGGDSPMHDAAAAARTAEAVLPDGIVTVYEGASHAVIGEQPERLASDILRHADRAEASSR
jgi:pimeloyl-ACP methyl ester carboxylesterase